MRRPIFVAAAVAALTGFVALVAAPLTPAAGAAARGTLAWSGCGGGVECATLAVPVDYRDPSGPGLDVALARIPARDPGHRIGSLVVNYGGPGDPGTQTLRLAGSSVPAAVRDRFDLVSFDPRGTGASKPIDCVDDATADRLFAEDPTPDTPADLPGFYAGTNSSVDVTAVCIQKYGMWLAQVGTRNVARDLERIRAALGDKRLTFLGYSYGTVLGAVYAELYPRHVRAMVLDSAVDLSNTAQNEELGNAEGFEAALDSFLADCAANDGCAFNSRGDPKAALERLRDQFEGGLTLRTSDGRRAGQAAFYLAMIAALYDEQNGWPALASALRSAAAGRRHGPAAPRRQLRRAQGRRALQQLPGGHRPHPLRGPVRRQGVVRLVPCDVRRLLEPVPVPRPPRSPPTPSAVTHGSRRHPRATSSATCGSPARRRS